MENALLIGLSRQIALQRNMDTIANNMANMNTAGYKSDHLLFEEFLMPVAQMTQQSGEAKILSYVDTPAQYRNYAVGSMEQTSNEFDVAISGKGWFVVQTPEGERYTRNGKLKLDTQGQIVTSEGHPILGESGAIVLTSDDTKLTIAEDGTMSTNQGEKGRLRVVSFPPGTSMHKEGTSLYSSNGEPLPADEVRLMQGMIEKSNVQPIVQLTQMMETIRAYTTTAQTLERTQKLREQAIETLAGTNTA